MTFFRKVLLLLAIAGLGIGCVYFYKTQQPVVDIAAPPTQGGFTLRSSAGPVSLADFRGKVVLLYFGYTFCPDICPTNLAAITQALTLLTPEEVARVRVVFVSVDPERDTPTRLAEYVAFFHPAMVGVTGTPEEVADVAKRYGAVYARQPSPPGESWYAVDHSASTYLIAPDGRQAATLPHDPPPSEIVKQIRRAL
ncbi:MAG: SCO family protein [Rhodocyclaceae bacterium]|nr:SCO family protein [Rhodocyclaceae bacterium]